MNGARDNEAMDPSISVLKASSTAQAKKMFYDWLDHNRPWSKHPNDMYALMEEIVNHAARCFADERLVTVDEVRSLERWLTKFTDGMKKHPDDYDGPCSCDDCMDRN